jgi:hypothetical protein
VCVRACAIVCVYQHERAHTDIGIIPPKDKVNIFGIFEYPILYCMYSPNTNKEISALLFNVIYIYIYIHTYVLCLL